MTVTVEYSTDAAVAGSATRGYLTADPVAHNVLCTLLAARRRASVPIRCWWAVEAGEVLGVAFQSPTSFPTVVSRLDGRAVGPLAGALAVATPAIPGCSGLADDAARMAGELATATRRPWAPVEGQRIYEVEHLVAPVAVPGGARVATDDDAPLLARWLEAFHAETGSIGSDAAPERLVREAIEVGRLLVWEVDGAPVASATVSAAEAGVARVGFVYTPPEQRGRGFAAAVTADASSRVLHAGHRCILYTQLANPTSNGIYQRLGYRPVGEVLRYAVV